MNILDILRLPQFLMPGGADRSPLNANTDDPAGVAPATSASAYGSNFNANDGGSGYGPAKPAEPGFFDQFISKVPGAQYLSPEERQGAIGLALLKAGAMGLQASQGRAGHAAPTLGSTAGAIAGGLGEGLHGMTDQALKGAAIQAQMVGKQKSIIEAQQLMRKNAAIQAFAKGDRSPAVLAELNPDKAVDQVYKPDEQLASQGMMRGPDGAAVPIPGYNQALAQQSRAKATGQMVPVAPGGQAFAMPAPDDVSGVPLQFSDVMKNNPHAILAAGAAKKAGVDPNLFLSLIKAESEFNPQAVSPKGAQGLGQLMPATAKARGVTDPFNAQQNATASAEEFRSLQDKYGDPKLAVMAYNWGQGNVDNWLKAGADPKAVPTETLTHVRKVLGSATPAVSAVPSPAQSQTQVNNGYLYDDKGRFIGFKSPDSASENTFDKTTGESLGKLFISKQEAVAANRQSASKMQAISDILKGIETGKGSEALLEGKRSLKAAGVNLEAIGLTDNVGAQDAARALANEMALELRNPAGGAGMPGAMSDQDRSFLQSMAGGLTMTSQGREVLLDARKRLAARSDQEASVVRQYAKAHGGRLDIGVYDALDTLATTPVFDAKFMEKANAAGGGGTPQAPSGNNLKKFWR